MTGRRQKIAEVAEGLGAVRLLRALHDRGRGSLTVLAYHRVMPVAHPDSYPFDLELISVTPEEFDWQMSWVRRQMNPVSLHQVVDHLAGRSELPSAAVVVTFDDGFNDTYRNAWPVLQRYAIPATVFVTTGYIDSGEPFWFELVAHLMLRVRPHAIRIEESTEAFPFGDSVGQRRRSLRRLHEVLKAMPNARRAAMIKEWAQKFAGDIDASVAELSMPLSWQQVKAMAQAGIDFGSHTVTHPNLRQLNDGDLARELSQSKQVLQSHLQSEIESVAYPIGTRQAYDRRVINAAKQAGFQLGVSYVSGVNWAGRMARFELRRQGVGMHVSRSYFRAMMQLPAWLD